MEGTIGQPIPKWQPLEHGYLKLNEHASRLAMNMQVVLAIKLFNSTSHISVVNTEHLAGDDDVESSLKLQGAGCKGRHIFFFIHFVGTA